MEEINYQKKETPNYLSFENALWGWRGASPI